MRVSRVSVLFATLDRPLQVPILTSDVGNDVRVGVLGQSLRNNRLATTESTGNGRRTTLDAREEGVEDTLSGEERHIGGDLLRGRAGSSHGPELAHGVLRLLSLEVELDDDVVDAVGALLGDVGDGSACARGKHDLVGVDERVLVDVAVDVAARDVVSDLEVDGVKVPLDGAIQGLGIDSSWDVDALCLLHDALEGPLDTVVNVGHESGTELHAEGLAGGENGVSDADARRLLVDLDGDLVGVDSDNLSDELVVADTDELVHGRADHVRGDDYGTGDAKDGTVPSLALLIPDLG